MFIRSVLGVCGCGPRVNKQGPRREFPPNFYLVKKSSPGTVSSANSGVASQYRFESSLKQEARAQGGAKNIITTTGIWNGEQSSGVLYRRNYKLCHAVIECCFAVCEAHSFYPHRFQTPNTFKEVVSVFCGFLSQATSVFALLRRGGRIDRLQG